jgi:NADPH:quinone reductase
MAKLRRARVIATVSSPEKEERARTAGADDIIRYDNENVVTRVRELTAGAGVTVVYDGVGRATFESSLAVLRKRGYLIVYGSASGQVPSFDIQRLNSGGSLYVTRPTLGHYTQTRTELLGRVDELLGWVQNGQLDVYIGGRYPLTEARRAHEDLASRRTIGKLLLLP